MKRALIGTLLGVGFAIALPGGGADEAAQTFTYTVSDDNAALFAAQVLGIKYPAIRQAFEDYRKELQAR